MNLGLTSRVVLITGASQGIGRAAARQFAAEGARVAITYYSEREKAESLVHQIRSDSGDAIAVPLDLGCEDSIRKSVEAVVSKWNHVDVLVNNAFNWGPTRLAVAPPFELLPVAEWRQSLRVNIEGVFFAIRCTLPSMRASGWGRIVNISSAIAEDGRARGTWYAAAKSALHGLTRSLSKELGPDGILVNSVMPGLTNTEHSATVSIEVRQRVESTIPIRRILEPEEVASAIVYLCSAANSGITGEILRVSGGRM